MVRSAIAVILLFASSALAAAQDSPLIQVAFSTVKVKTLCKASDQILTRANLTSWLTRCDAHSPDAWVTAIVSASAPRMTRAGKTGESLTVEWLDHSQSDTASVHYNLMTQDGDPYQGIFVITGGKPYAEVMNTWQVEGEDYATALVASVSVVNPALRQ